MATPFTRSDLAKLTDRAKKLSSEDLRALVENPADARNALKLTMADLQSLQSLAATKMAAGTRPTPGCCCCCCVRGACCCCCGAASATQA